MFSTCPSVRASVINLAHDRYNLPVWLSSNSLVLNNVVTLRQARLVPGWVTVSGR